MTPMSMTNDPDRGPESAAPEPTGSESVPGAGEPTLVDLDAWDGLVFSTTGAYWKLSGAFGRVHAWMHAHAVAPAGPALGLFYDDPGVTPPEECRYSICYPLGADDLARVRGHLTPPGAADATATSAAAPPLLPHDTLELRHFPAESAAVVEYEGPAADSPAVYALLASWVAAHDLIAHDAPRERYVAEPGTLGGGRMHAWVEQAVTPRS
jgi:DNA gyrase inhibitor GyrI